MPTRNGSFDPASLFGSWDTDCDVGPTYTRVNGRIVPIHELSDGDVLAWRDLAKNAIEPNPLFEPECLIPAARNLPNGAEMLLVIAEDEGEFFGCFPIIWVAGDSPPSTTWSGIRRPTFSTQVRRLRYDGTPLVREQRGIEAAAALLSVLTRRDRTKNAGILVFESIENDGPVSSNIASAAKQLKLPIHTYRTWTRPVVRRRDELTYRSIHGSKYLRKIAKWRRQLGERLGGEVQFVNRSADPLAVDQLIAIEAAGYKSKAGGDLASHPGEAEWFREMCDQFREEDRVILYSLQVSESVIAMQLMLRAGEGLFGLQTVFDEEYARFSPGIQLHVELIDRFHNETDAQWSDTCTYAGNKTLLHLYPDRRTFSTVLVAVGGPVERSYFRLYAAAQDFLGVDSTFRRRHARVSGALDWAAWKLVNTTRKKRADLKRIRARVP